MVQQVQERPRERGGRSVHARQEEVDEDVDEGGLGVRGVEGGLGVVHGAHVREEDVAEVAGGRGRVERGAVGGQGLAGKRIRGWLSNFQSTNLEENVREFSCDRRNGINLWNLRRLPKKKSTVTRDFPRSQCVTFRDKH